MNPANTIGLVGSATLEIGANELLDFPGCKIGHRRLDLIAQKTYEIHGGPAPDFSFQDFWRSTFDNTKLQGNIFLKRAYNAGSDIPLSRSSVAIRIDGSYLDKMAYMAVTCANDIFKDEEYRWFGPNSNTYNHFVLMYISAAVSSIDKSAMSAIDLTVPSFYLPNSWPWEKTLKRLPKYLQRDAEIYVRSCLKLNPTPWDTFSSSNLCESIITLFAKMIGPFEDVINLMVDSAIGSAVGITKVAKELLDRDASGVVRALKELAEFTISTVEKAVNVVSDYANKQIIKPVKRLIDKIKEFFGL